MYSIKEIFYTLQGEGAQAGRVSVFCRFSGCNLWTGREKDRASAICQFCDTQFVGTDGLNGGKYTLDKLIQTLEEVWQAHDHDFEKHVVLTGGEPFLQIDEDLVTELKASGFFISVESNGTQEVDAVILDKIDHLTISPKRGAPIVLSRGDELKVVFQQNWRAKDWDAFENLDFKHFYVQAMHVPADEVYRQHLDDVIHFCYKRPKWRMSVQTHKFLNIM
jgi:7-carboxy-7-deazaguanine synthase